MTTKKSLEALKGTTFGDLFDLPAQDAPSTLNPLTMEEFNENVVPVAMRVLYDIMMDKNAKEYSRTEAAKILLDRSLGKPVSKQLNGEITDPEALEAMLPRVIQRPRETPKE